MSEQAPVELCEDHIGLVLREGVDRRLVPGVVAAVSDRDRTIYTVGFGAASRRAGVALGPHSIFRIASMTKLVTSIAVLMLAEEGRLDLDAPLAQYLPDYEQPGVLEDFEPGSGTYVTRSRFDSF
jgi:methyl acetate hydrolase